MTNDEEISKRIHYNRNTNGILFEAMTAKWAVKHRIEFQQRLVDALFHIVEAEDFAKVCRQIAKDMRLEIVEDVQT